MACPSISPGGAFLSGVLSYVDCQAQAIGQGGYQALTAPGSIVAVLLTGLLTIFVALFGYRMIMGQTPGTRDGVMALVKIGVVLALATSWPRASAGPPACRGWMAAWSRGCRGSTMGLPSFSGSAPASRLTPTRSSAQLSH